MGQALSAAFGLRHVHEPSNPSVCPQVEHFYYSTQSVADLSGPFGYALDHRLMVRLKSAFFSKPRHWGSRSLTALTGEPTLLKDPFAFFNAKLLAEVYQLDVVLCVRHPAGVVSSAMRLGWNFDFEDLMKQSYLAHELQPWKHLIEAQLRREPSVLEEVALLWSVLHNWWAQSPSAPTKYTVADHAALVSMPEQIGSLLPGRTSNARGLESFLTATRSGSGPPDAARYDDLRRSAVELEKPWKRRLSTAELSQVHTITGAAAQSWGFGDSTW